MVYQPALQAQCSCILK